MAKALQVNKIPLGNVEKKFDHENELIPGHENRSIIQEKLVSIHVFEIFPSVSDASNYVQ